MAFDHDNHTLDPATGYQVHKDTGHRIGLDPAPPARASHDTEFPKWVHPHAGHVVRTATGHVCTPRFPDCEIDRADGSVKVLVNSPQEEAIALADPVALEAAKAAGQPFGA